MSYTAPNRLLTPERHSIDTAGDSWLIPNNSSVSFTTWPTANLAIYVPLRVPATVLVRKLWFGSGSTGTGNVDMGVYDLAGNAVVTSSTAAKAASLTEQVLDITDTVLPRGTYYIALSSDTATDDFVFVSNPAAPNATAFGLLTEASAYPLPSTATFALTQTLAFIPLCGLLLETTVA